MSEPTISAEAHEAAVGRYIEACRTVAELRLAYQRDMAEAEDELDAAGTELAAQELTPGIPAYIMQAGPQLRAVEDQAEELRQADAGHYGPDGLSIHAGPRAACGVCLGTEDRIQAAEDQAEAADREAEGGAVLTSTAWGQLPVTPGHYGADGLTIHPGAREACATCLGQSR